MGQRDRIGGPSGGIAGRPLYWCRACGWRQTRANMEAPVRVKGRLTTTLHCPQCYCRRPPGPVREAVPQVEVIFPSPFEIGPG